MIYGNLNIMVTLDFHIHPVRLSQQAMWPWINMKFRAVLTPRVLLSWYVPQTNNLQLWVSPAPKRINQETPADKVWQIDCSTHCLSSAHTAAVTSAVLLFSLVAKHHYYNSIKSKVIFPQVIGDQQFPSPSWSTCFHLYSMPVMLMTD